MVGCRSSIGPALRCSDGYSRDYIVDRDWGLCWKRYWFVARFACEIRINCGDSSQLSGCYLEKYDAPEFSEISSGIAARTPGHVIWKHHHCGGISSGRPDPRGCHIGYAVSMSIYACADGCGAAYGETMKIMIIVATVFAVPPIIFAFFMPDLHLGDTQNAVDAANLSGETGTNATPAPRRDDCSLRP